MVLMAIFIQVVLEVINVCKVKILNLKGKYSKHFCSGIFPINEMGALYEVKQKQVFTHNS